MPRGVKTWRYLQDFLEAQVFDCCFLTNEQLRLITRCDDRRTNSQKAIKGGVPSIKDWADKAHFSHEIINVQGININMFVRKPISAEDN